MAKIKLDAEQVVCRLFENCIKGRPQAKNTALDLVLRADFSAIADDGEFTACKLFHIVYWSPSNYTRVMYKQVDFAGGHRVPGNYRLIADHDSCWRDNWCHIEQDMEAMVNDLKSRSGNAAVTDLSSVEFFRMLNIAVTIPSDYRRGYQILKVSGCDSYGVVPQDLPDDEIEKYNLVKLEQQ